MSGNTATTAIAPVANQSVVVQRLCEMFGKNYDEVSAAIQSEMTAMEHELQCWKLQMSDRAATTTTTTTTVESKTKKAPRAKKAAATTESGSESDASVAPAPAPAAAATAVETKAKKPAAPRAKKADKSAVASAAETVAPADEQKAKKAPRAKKVAAADKPIEVVAQQVDEVVDTNVDVDDESVFEEIEIEVVEFTFDGVKYLRSKNDDNTVYDPETSDVIGKWNEETGCIDAE